MFFFNLTKIIMKNLITIILATGLSLASAHAATIVEFNFTGGSLASSDPGTNWTSSTIDITSNSSRFNTTALADSLTWGFSPGLGDAINLGDYAEFSITADLGFTLALTDISFNARTPASPGANPTVYMRSDADSFATNLVQQDLPKNQSTFILYEYTISDTIVSESTRTFRLYFDSGNAGGTNNIFIDDIQITGTATVVPEPSSFALLAGCFGLTWVMLRRRRS